MAKHHFDDFRYSAKSLDGDIIDDGLVQRTREKRIRTDAASDDGQVLGVFTTTPEMVRYPEIIVRATAFSDDNGRSENGVFDAYLAEATHRRVMAVNTPGVDYFNKDQHTKQLSRLTPGQHEELKLYGSFRKLGEASMRAIQNAVVAMGGEYDPSFIISASSMGVANAAGMIRQAFDKDSSLAGVVLAEPVNHIRRPLGKLGLQFMMTNGVVPKYLEMNPQAISDTTESMGFWLKRVVEGRVANSAYARAMSAGTFSVDLGSVEALADTKTPLYITHGTASRLSSDKSGRDMEQFLAGFAAVDTLEHDAFKGHDHPYTMTIQSVIDGIGRVTRE